MDFRNGDCLLQRSVRGRILEAHLPLAEESFPGIGEMYQELGDKSLTFLQLVWIYEEARADALAVIEAEQDPDAGAR